MYKALFNFSLQMGYFNNRYRVLAYLVSFAVDDDKEDDLLRRIEEINGDLTTEENEIFNARLLKEYSAGLRQEDIKRPF